jgi:ParB/RepB/Spo0J family partition protein
MSQISSEIVNISPNEIVPNPENPRLIFYTEGLDILKQSIRKYGILVPTTVFRRSSTSKYTILDGERRWRCSQVLSLKTIPAIVIPPPDKKQNILLMFNIHKVREEWELVPTALKLEVLLRMMPDSSDKELAVLTGMTTARVRNCIRVLRFDKKYLDMTLIDDKSRRIRGEFFSQLEEALEKLDKDDYKELGLTRNQIIDIMIEKYQSKEFTNLIHEFRTLRKVLTSKDKGVAKKEITKNVKEYLHSKPVRDPKTGKIKSRVSADEIFEKTSYSAFAEEEIIKAAKKLDEILYKFDFNKVQDKERVRKILKKLATTIDEILHL